MRLSCRAAHARQSLIPIKFSVALLVESGGVHSVTTLASQSCSAQSNSSNFGFLTLAQGRRAREHQTIAAMIACYCRGHHRGGDRLCPGCQGLLDYATVRLDRCRFGEEKPTCAKCPVHCYQSRRREQVKEVMRYAGPRMLWEHPILAIRHWLDGRAEGPQSLASTSSRTEPTLHPAGS